MGRSYCLSWPVIEQYTQAMDGVSMETNEDRLAGRYESTQASWRYGSTLTTDQLVGTEVLLRHTSW